MALIIMRGGETGSLRAHQSVYLDRKRGHVAVKCLTSSRVVLQAVDTFEYGSMKEVQVSLLMNIMKWTNRVKSAP